MEGFDPVKLSAEAHRLAREAARNLTEKRLLPREIDKDGVETGAKIYLYAWSTQHKALAKQVLDDCVCGTTLLQCHELTDRRLD